MAEIGRLMAMSMEAETARRPPSIWPTAPSQTMLVRMIARCAWVAVTTTLLACGSGGGSGVGNCNVGACGGNLVGSWKITGSCSNASGTTMPMSTCPSETVHVNSSTTGGTLTFNADMTYTTSLTISGAETAMVPVSCLSAGGATGTCDELAMFFNDGIFGDAGTSTASCTTSGSDCDCNIALSVQSTATGTYSVSGASLTTMSQSGVGNGTYCVRGNTLNIISSPDGGTTTGTGGGDLVATKE